ncbi:MamI family restriction endonuclease [Aliarcobacter skirrowii]|uniref:MamI family restriction endonuclease n=1 Tax=Aliarcobacter skirrowii TaxID=28200 RepID=UPI0029AFC6E5|nr:MamI family restriction endonuclease [Aliarcobacter skirrowii]MDX4050349.1 MamI family restriction endonuclease [Aliarcobacter skirrowii]
MQPDICKIRLNVNEQDIKDFLNQCIFLPRLNTLYWSNITKQTPNLKIGYPGQHLASLITGMEGERTGARGNDLTDGSEIKSCSRVDQLDKCRVCGSSVLRIENNCPNCNSNRIERKKDSKWLFSIKNEEELRLLTLQTNRIMFILFDYPNFNDNDFNTIQINIYEVWNNSARNQNFRRIMFDYYNNTYLYHISQNPNKTPAPYNMWPDSFAFHQCNPINVFKCTIFNANMDPHITIDNRVLPATNRDTLPSILTPVTLLTPNELREINNASDQELGILLKPGVTVGNVRNILENGSDTTIVTDINNCLICINETLRNYISPRVARDPFVIGTQIRPDRN